MVMQSVLVRALEAVRRKECRPGTEECVRHIWRTEAAETQVRMDAAARNLPLERYREKLRKRYRDAIRALRGKSAYQEYY